MTVGWVAAGRRSLCLVLAVAGAAGCSSGAAGGSTVPMPGRSATPEQVAHAYLRAAKAHDCGLTAALTLHNTWRWCADPRLLDYRAVSSAHAVPAAEAGRDEECVDFDMNTHGSSDGSMPTGWQPWSLCLVSTGDGWRLYDQGQG